MALKILSHQTVLDAARDRIRWIFDEFPVVIVNDSGGKDSTVIFELALEVAREKGRLPLNLLWIDQEAEWEGTVEQIRRHMTHPDVNPLWVQCPFRLFNATSSTEHWLECWHPEQRHKWMREQEPYAIKDNIFGVDRFIELLDAVPPKMFPGQKIASIGGVRCEESPARAMGLTSFPSYKWVTWSSKKAGPNHVLFYPIYDWTLTDVWKAIHEHGWAYNRIYDEMFRYGIPPAKMRISNLHHETAVHALFFLQEIEPQTWEKLSARIEGIDMAGKMQEEAFFPQELPFMFRSWEEYRDYLLGHLIVNPDHKSAMKKHFINYERWTPPELLPKLTKVQIRSILTSDWEAIKLNNFYASAVMSDFRMMKKKGELEDYRAKAMKKEKEDAERRRKPIKRLPRPERDKRPR